MLTGLIIAEVPIVTGCGWAVIWYLLRRHLSEADERDERISDLAGGLSVIVPQVARIDGEVERNTHRLQDVAENLAVVAAFVDRHERWHERHSPTT